MGNSSNWEQQMVVTHQATAPASAATSPSSALENVPLPDTNFVFTLKSDREPTSKPADIAYGSAAVLGALEMQAKGKAASGKPRVLRAHCLYPFLLLCWLHTTSGCWRPSQLSKEKPLTAKNPKSFPLEVI